MRQPAYFAYPLSTVAPRDLMLCQYLDISPSDAVLEIGVGSGSSMLRLVGDVALVHGVDISAGCVERTRGCLNQRKIPVEQAQLFVMDFCETHAAERLPMRYDAIFSCDTLEHVSSPGRFLANVHASLKCGGRAFITFPNEPEGSGHGVTSFGTFEDLAEAVVAAGFLPGDVRISTCELTEWASGLLQLAWLKPRRWSKKVIRRIWPRTAPPQVFDETDFHRSAEVLNPLAPIINAYCWAVMKLMSASKPAYRLTPLGKHIVDCQIVIQARRSQMDAA